MRLVALTLLLSLSSGCGMLGKKSNKADESEDEASTKKKSDDEDEDTPKKKKPKKAKANQETTATASAAAAAPPATTAPPTPLPERPPLSGTADVDRPVTAPEEQSYAFDGVTKIPDGCSNAFAIVANAPDSVGVDYAWPNTKQALVANGQYKVVATQPTGLGEVAFQVHHADATMNNAWVLVARCNSGSTCNHLAAMIKSVVKTSRPQPGCGTLPAALGPVVKNLYLLPGGPRANVPTQRTDVQSLCARISACTMATTPSTKEDVLVACQKEPHNFKTECAMQWPCAAVMSCVGR